MAKDLRSFLDLLSAQRGELVRVRRAIRPAHHEASAIVSQLEAQGRFPVVLFEQTHNVGGSRSDLRLAMNLFGTMARIGQAMDLEQPTRLQVLEEYTRRDRLSIPPAALPPGAGAPVQEVVLQGSEVNLNRLPIPRDKAMDGGPYLTPLVVARDGATGRYNTSWNRAMLLDQRRMAIHVSPRHLWSYFMREEGEGRNLPMALVVGHHPAVLLSGAGLTPLNTDEYDAAGGLVGQPVRLVPSVSYGDRLMVPADAELIIEGEAVAGKRAVEGPYGEFTYYTGPQKLSWVFEAKAVTHRRDAILTVTYSCSNDHLNAHLPIEANLLQRAREAVPTVRELCCFDSGAPMQAVISMKKTVEGQPMRAAMAAMSAGNFVKHVIVVDEEIDPTDWRQVMWAMCTRIQAERDVVILKGLQGGNLDPSLRTESHGSGMIIDATRPLGRPFPIRAAVPADAVARVPVAEYVEEE